MNLFTKKTAKKDIRDVLNDKRAIERAVRGSIKDQKKESANAAKLRAAHASR